LITVKPFGPFGQAQDRFNGLLAWQIQDCGGFIAGHGKEAF
jgi:hypothetical protein